MAWWEANADGLRAGRRRRLDRTETDPLANVGEGGRGSDARRPVQRAVADVILPTLRAVIERPLEENADVVGSALLALAKVTDDPADIGRIRTALRRRETPTLERECAALALGCLRRSDPAHGFDGRELDLVRQDLLAALDDDSMGLRGRSDAALALGLLGDQATRPGDAFAKDGRMVVRGLWARLTEEHPSDELAVAMLVGLSLQPRAGVPDGVLLGLRGLVATGSLAGQRRSARVGAHAALALARLSDGEATGVFLGILKGRTHPIEVRRSAVVALGLLAPGLDAARRNRAVDALLGLARKGDPDTSGIAWVTIGRLLAADLADGSGELLARTGLVDDLADASARGAHDVRPFAALALALAAEGRDRSLDVPAFGALRTRALEALHAGAGDERMDPSIRGAFLIGLGIARDRASARLLSVLARGVDVAPLLRAHASAGLGLLGEARVDVLASLRAALGDRSDEGANREAARALGFLGDARSVPDLLDQIRRGGSDLVLARAALALGAIRDPSAARSLAEIVEDHRASNETRAVAVAALGLLGDLEDVRSLARLSIDSNYLAWTASLAEAVSIL